jgi:hypothetical protein
MEDSKIELKVSEDDGNVAYVSLPDHPGKGTFGVVKNTLRLRDIYSDYVGPDLLLDFDKEQRLIGIEKPAPPHLNPQPIPNHIPNLLPHIKHTQIMLPRHIEPEEEDRFGRQGSYWR